MTHCDPYPTYTRPERIADGVMHATGVLFALIGPVLLIGWAKGRTDAAMLAGLWVYGAALIASFTASACYHFTPWEGLRPWLRRVDHAAIYLKIAGTYTPLVVLVGSASAYGVLALVWLLAIAGVLAKLFFWSRPTRWGAVLYVAMGWLSLTLLSSLWPVVPVAALVLIGLGGVIYTSGAVVFSLDGLRFQNAIWHGFVNVPSGCFFAAITLAAAAA